MAEDIRRRAERDANELRRDAAEWASATRREAEHHRDRILAELDELRRPGYPAAGDRPEDDGPDTDGDVIDLRRAVGARRGASPPVEDPDIEDPDIDDLDHDELDVGAYDPQRAMGGTYVVGRPRPPVETSIDTKLNDVVRQVVRRTFNRSYP